MLNRLWFEKNIAAESAHFRWYTIDDDDLTSIARSMNDLFFRIFAGAAIDTAFHFGQPLCVGVIHLGGNGIYAVMMIRTGWAVVQTI